MKVSNFILFCSLFFGSCANNRALSLRMLDERSGYEDSGDKPLDVTFAPSDNKVVPKRSAPVIADIWLHPNELATSDYFLGGWIRSVVKEPHWTTSESLEKVFKPITKPDPEPQKTVHERNELIRNRRL